MNIKAFSKIRATYIFNIFATILILISIAMYFLYIKTQKNIIEINHKENIKYVSSLSENLSKDIKHILKKDFIVTLQDDLIAREYIASDLKLFVTTKYKYIYLISKSSSGSFIHLADSQTERNMKKMFNDVFEPRDKEKYEEVYKSKEAIYFKNVSGEIYWATYLSPILVNGKVESVIVIKFSIEDQHKIFEALDRVKNMFIWIFGFFSVVFIFLLWFSYIDKQREKQKNIVFNELQDANINLQIKTIELKVKSDEISELNENLERRVKEEVHKNRIKDTQMIHQARLAQMGEMISMIAHQWRQPLSSISAESANLLLKTRLGTINNDIIINGSGNISKYSQYLSDTIEDFRDFFKPDKDKIPTNYLEIINSVETIINSSLANRNISIIKELECHDNFVSYPNELKQVILNLIKNSEDALTDNNIENPYIHLKTFATENGCYILEVSDNAGGIDEDIIDKIFDPYFSTKSKKDGTGLGLYMSKMIIEEHCQGELSVDNRDDGAIFRIILGEMNV